jgi:post-segregation antitoxin (ccd killing protein)
MARLNVWVPDELAEQARSEGLNVSAVTQAALSDELACRDLDAWLDSLPEPRRDGPSHEAAMRALDEAREEFGRERG